MHSPTVAVIHTSPAIVEIFSRLLAAQLPQARCLVSPELAVAGVAHALGAD